MTSKNETKILILSILITAGLVGTGFQWVTLNFGRSSNSFLLPYKGQTTSVSRQAQISLGDTILVKADANPDKQAGVRAFAQGDFDTASTKFLAALQVNRNDPEALIYLNNARVENSSPFKIVVSVPIGGNLNIAKEILRGVAQAQDEVNRSGSIKLQVVIANDENDPAIAQQLATEFVKDTSIVAVVGHNASNASIAAAPVYQQGELVMISPTSFAQNLSGIGSYVFRTVPSTGIMADNLSDYIIKTARKSNIAICVDSKAIDNVSFKDEFVKAFAAAGGKVTPLDCDLFASDFNPNTVISQAIANGADSLLLASYVDRIDRAIEVTRANQGRLALFASPTLYTFKTLQSGQADVNGMVLSVPWHPAAIPGNPFPSNAVQRWGGAVNWRSATAYDATQAIITALKQGNTSRDALQKALSSPGFSVNGATGTIQFRPSGDRNGTPMLLKVQPGNQSGTGYDFVLLRP
ncbi:MAG TPA: ABC transporter substrate-binding protein [Coleofasciculaceae cyanobacterium]